MNHRQARSLFRLTAVLGGLWVGMFGRTGFAQDSSLFHRQPAVPLAATNQAIPTADPRNPASPMRAPNRGVQGQSSARPYGYPAGATANSLGLQQASWTYVPPPPLRRFQLHDIITIRVDEVARMRAEGAAENRKNSLYDVVLQDWLKLTGGDLKPATQADGDPRVNGALNSLYRADASIESRESLSFNIAAEVVDIRPNGNLVLEASKQIWNNENVFETSLIGICRAEDIGPDNVVLSRDLLNAEIRKDERGRLRDGYRRGWFQRWFEEFQLF